MAAKNETNRANVSVVIPAYRAEPYIRKVIAGIPEFISSIIVVDDCSPDRTSEIVTELMRIDPRLVLIQHERNLGVGGAMLTGYRAACEKGADVIVKMDSDDQMDPKYIRTLVTPILSGKADYAKANRFLITSGVQQMPVLRRLGNLGLSFMTKMASGYWNIFDPTNGYTAIRSAVVPLLNTKRLSRRYFFESSLLIELGLLRAVVKDVSIPARYGNEKSSLSELKCFFEFPLKLLLGWFYRVIYMYFIRDFSAISLFLIFGSLMVIFGVFWGIWHWVQGAIRGVDASTGTVMLAVLPLIIGLQLLLQAAVLDIQNVPTEIIDPTNP
jgi:glycosyltransferase involved in cell wall biosynthesis